MTKSLQGIKIIDFTRLLPGPLGTNMLAQMGAEVIKIESPNRMDFARVSGTQVDGASVLFHQLNHNKTLKMVDYNTEEGKAALFELIKDANALVEQFRPGVMESWGFGYEAVKAINPGIVYVSLTGYGQDNPFSKVAGHDLNYMAYSGLQSLVKDDKGKPIVSDSQIADICGSYSLVMALQAALLKKERTGEGSFVDVSMADSAIPFLTIPFSLFKSELDYRQFNLINGKTTVNYAVYECADGKWISIAAMELKFWNKLAELVGKPDWKRDSPFELSTQQFSKEEVETLFRTRARDEWMTLFEGHDVCVAPILEIEELENSHYHKSKGSFEKFKTKNGIELTGINLPFKIV